MRIRSSRLAVCAALVSIALATVAADAQESAGHVSQWIGALDGGIASRDRRTRESPPVPVMLLIITAPDGQLGGVMGRLDTNRQMAVQSVRIEGDAILFSVPDLSSSFSGTVSADGRTLKGTLTDDKSGKSSPLEFSRGPASRSCRSRSDE